VYVVNPVVRIKGSNRELRWKTTPNRARKRIRSLVDRSTSRSFSLKIVGVKKGSDIKLSKSVKFRNKKSNDPRVQIRVEKVKYAIDTSGEKRGLKLGKLLKGRRRKVSKKKPKRRKVVKRKPVKRKVVKKRRIIRKRPKVKRKVAKRTIKRPKSKPKRKARKPTKRKPKRKTPSKSKRKR